MRETGRRRKAAWSASSSECDERPRLSVAPCRRKSPFVVAFAGLGLLLGVALLLYAGLGPPERRTESLLLRDVDDGAVFGVPRAALAPSEAAMAERLTDMKRIRDSLLEELRSLEERRAGLLDGIRGLEETESGLRTACAQLERRRSKLQAQAEAEAAEASERRQMETPPIRLPAKLQSSGAQVFTPTNNIPCSMTSCFDHSQCSLVGGFTVSTPTDFPLTSLQPMPLPSAEPCLSVSMADGPSEPNTLLFDVRGKAGTAMRAASDFSPGSFRAGFDVVLPVILDKQAESDSIWSTLPRLLPLRRSFLLSFAGSYRASGVEDLDTTASRLVAAVAALPQLRRTPDRFSLAWACEGEALEAEKGDWALCEDTDHKLRESIFALILPSAEVIGGAVGTSTAALRQISRALKAGAIPVVLGPTLLLPFGEALDWRRAAVIVHAARVPELHFLLHSLADEDVMEMRTQGRRIFEKYLCCPQTSFDATIAIIRSRLGMPGPAVEGAVGVGAFPGAATGPPASKTTELPPSVDQDEYLGPVELPLPSPTFTHNLTLQGLHAYKQWNDVFSPFHLSAFLPFRSPLPSEAQFTAGTEVGFRPIGNGAGGSGKEFSRGLGGNWPREQFTIVMLTYERNEVLVSSLQRLNDLPYLHKIIVVWNSPTPPPAEMLWPKLSAPVVFLRGDSNSLNNRFLPYTEIETEAVFSIDDDVHLTQAEIVFAFRVWRENRERIVGFPGRFHAWDGGAWRYNSNHSCQLSMVLTGAAFFHKWYAEEYSRAMASVIREKVEELVNCEDLALNALVAHVTRQPPIKVTSKWTFRCPGCPETLSADESHFAERHDCLRLIADVFGYNPLLYTQFRVDSVLFKTRLPHQHQKCFKFI